jgi:hypothetical protein
MPGGVKVVIVPIKHGVFLLKRVASPNLQRLMSAYFRPPLAVMARSRQSLIWLISPKRQAKLRQSAGVVRVRLCLMMRLHDCAITV